MTSTQKNVYGIAAVFGIPIIAGFLMYLNIERFGFDSASANYGRLIEPIQTVDNFLYFDPLTAKDADDARKWIYLAIAGDTCDQLCLDRIQTIKKIRLFTNQKMRRVRSTILTPAPIDGFSSDGYFSVVVDEDGSKRKPFQTYDQNSIYLMDPLGNIIIEYKEFNLNRMLDDINRLLKYSRIG